MYLKGTELIISLHLRISTVHYWNSTFHARFYYSMFLFIPLRISWASVSNTFFFTRNDTFLWKNMNLIFLYLFNDRNIHHNERFSLSYESHECHSKSVINLMTSPRILSRYRMNSYHRKIYKNFTHFIYNCVMLLIFFLIMDFHKLQCQEASVEVLRRWHFFTEDTSFHQQ